MDILHLIAANNFIPVNKTLIRLFGTDCAVLIGHFAGLQLYYQKSFYNTSEQIEEETGIKIHSIRKAVQTLQEKGILLVEKHGLPCKLYYLLDSEKLSELLLSQKTSFANSKNCNLENTKLVNMNSKNILNINNKNKIKNINNITPLPGKDILENVSSPKMVRTHSSKQFKQAAKNRKSKQYLPLAITLAKIIETSKNIKILQSPTKTLSWAGEFQILIEKQGIDQSRITDALAWYEKNIGGEYIPVIESGKSFREKFTKLEDAIKRGKQVNKSKVTIGTLRGGKTSSIDFNNDNKVIYTNFKSKNDLL